MCREGAWDELAVGVTSGIAIRSGMLVKKDCIYKKSVLSYVQKKQRDLQGRKTDFEIPLIKDFHSLRFMSQGFSFTINF